MDRIHVLLLDVEGTTTPVDYVYRTLFPYARARLEAYLVEHWSEDDTRAEVERLAAEHARETGAAPPWRSEPGAVAAYLAWLMDQDRKSTGLKSVQGRIWAEGYHRGELRGTVYPDVPRAFERWRRDGRRIAIFSSGSVLAQRLLFANSTAGDLTAHIDAYFDTTTGAKRDAASYERIASALGVDPGAMLFLSDVAAELDAAATAGMRTALSLRDGAEPPPSSSHMAVRSFEEVETE
ncbi:MAG TPA: acireductone synthase [Vicinamibacteria bacterium]|nr:acireductone synthase [Vicinamibacteria bacterium]